MSQQNSSSSNASEFLGYDVKFVYQDLMRTAVVTAIVLVLLGVISLVR